MLQPVELADFFSAFFSAALVILAGGGYALLFAWSRLSGNKRYLHLAFASYAVLAAAVAQLALSLHLQGHWLALTAAMLLGYLLAPSAIWHLCVGTHAGETEIPANPTTAEERGP